jgi:hypothetical protein
MSVESGVGVACGCLPGCKPLMNRMFPRIFASSSQSSSYPRPSGQGRFAKKFGMSSSSGQQSEQESYNMHSLRSNDQGVVISEKQQEVEPPKTPAPPPPSRQALRPSSRLAFSRSGRRYGELDDVSDSSSDIIILQRSSADERYWSRDDQKV